jgi:peptidoglycan-N-acetylglucosamine deacetylase
VATELTGNLRGAVLVRQGALGGFEAPGPRPLPAPDPLLRWGRPLLLPLSSVMRARTADPVIALSYDDGPDLEQTPAVLDVLAEHGARATFFVLTDRAEAEPGLVRRMLAEGHEIGLHGIDHARLTRVPGREAVRRLRLGRQRLEAITGRPVRLYRPTYGDVGMTAFAGARLLGLEIVIWSAWARDWFDAPPQEIADRAVGALHPGAILLLHDSPDGNPDDNPAGDATGRPGAPPAFSRADVTRRILDGMCGGGFTSVTVGDLLRRYPAVRSLTVRRPRLPAR